MKEEKFMIVMLTYENIGKLKEAGRTKIFKTLLKEFLKELEDKKEIEINVKVSLKQREMKAYQTKIDKSDYERLRELSKLNGVSLATLNNFIIQKYLG